MSTVELYKIAIAVKRKEITPEEARSVIKQFGRIEFGAAKQKKPQ